MIREEMVNEYIRLYYEKKTRLSYAKNYAMMLELWIQFTPEERELVDHSINPPKNDTK